MEITLIKKNDERINRKTGRPMGRLRTVAYARVSTDNDEQLNSYESQKKYYKEKIVSNSEWSFAGIYADEGISGTQDFKRENFMKMIEDGMGSKFDLILTKSISRFARNTLDTLKYVRLLKEKNIAILFEEENINTLEMSGELLLTVLSSVAQQESETISSHVKLGLKMKSERGELVGFNNCYGYSPRSDFIFKPNFTWDEIVSLSCCATELKTVNNNSPDISRVFIFSSSNNIAIFFSFNNLTYFNVSKVLRANLEIDLVSIKSNFDPIPSSIIFIKFSLLKSCVPDIPSSAYIPAKLHSLLDTIFSL